MAKTLTHVLLVEGFADRDFFEQVCKRFNLHPFVQVATSKDYQAARNTKEDVFKLLPNLLKKVEDGEIERLAVVVDADKKEHGSGFDKTINKVKAEVAKHDFELETNNTNGFIFKHIDDEFSDIGLWIMPDNNSEGILENFIETCIKTDERDLFNHANKIVQELENKKFAQHHQIKAEIATWLAWQKPPGRGLYASLEDSLLNEDNELFKELKIG